MKNLIDCHPYELPCWGTLLLYVWIWLDCTFHRMWSRHNIDDLLPYQWEQQQRKLVVCSNLSSSILQVDKTTENIIQNWELTVWHLLFLTTKKRHKLVSLVWSNFVLRHSNNIFSLPQKSIMIQCNPPLIFMQLHLLLYFTWYNQGTVITQWPLFMSTFLLQFFSMKQNKSLQLFALQLSKYPPLPPSMRWVVVLVYTTQIPNN